MNLNAISKVFKSALPAPIPDAKPKPSFSSKSSFEALGARKSGLQKLEKNLMPQTEWTGGLSPELQAIFDSHRSQSKKQAERTAKAQFNQEFSAKALNPEGFHSFMKQIYGEGYDQSKAESLRQRTLVGDSSWLPPVQFLDDQTLQGGYGAFEKKAGVVYLNEKLLGHPGLIGQTYIEEVGHFLDAQLNPTDTKGDEGEMFRRTLGGERLSDSELQAIRGENDHGQISVNGKLADVEFLMEEAVDTVYQGADSGDGFGDFGGDFGDFGGDIGDSMGSELGSAGEVAGLGDGNISDPSPHPSESQSLTASYPEPIYQTELQNLEGDDKDPPETSEGGKDDSSEAPREREEGVMYLGRVEISGKKDPSEALKAEQSIAIPLGDILIVDGEIRADYAKKADKFPRTTEGSLAREQLKLQTRAALSAIGRGASEIAAENKDRKQARAAKSQSEMNKTVGKTSPTWNAIGAASEVLGRGLLVAGVGVSAYNIANAPEGEKTKTTVKEGGTWVGALVVGKLGAEALGALGTMIVPGLGTLIGGVVGLVGGALVGGFGGSELGEIIYDSVEPMEEYNFVERMAK